MESASGKFTGRVIDFEAKGHPWRATMIPEGDVARVWISMPGEYGSMRYAFSLPASAMDEDIDAELIMSKGGSVETLDWFEEEYDLELDDGDWEGVNEGDGLYEYKAGPFKITVTKTSV